MVLAISGACARLGGISCAAAFMLGFDTLLRPGELYKVPKRDITWAGGRAVLTLKHTKTGQRKAAQEMAICHSQIANLWVSRPLANKAGSDLLLDCSPQALRALFFATLEHLDIKGLFSMYSLRPGGATWHFLLRGSMEATLLRGRWLTTSTARVYLQGCCNPAPLTNYT